MKVIGLVGGVASGKSTVAGEFARLGAAIVNADESAHRALELPDVKSALVDRWGGGILLPDGSVDRSAVARRVFGAGDADAVAQERAFLEGLVHPKVRSDVEDQLARFAQAGTPATVLDVPLLVEVGWERLCDVVYFVDAPLEARLQRAAARGWSAEELRDREAAQAPLASKRLAADRVLENAGDIENLRRQVAAAWQQGVVGQ